MNGSARKFRIEWKGRKQVRDSVNGDIRYSDVWTPLDVPTVKNEFATEGDAEFALATWLASWGAHEPPKRDTLRVVEFDTPVPVRNQISPDHPVFGGPHYRKLSDDEVLLPGDETACVSTLLKMEAEPWVEANWADGKTTVLQSLEKDADEFERVYRRKV